MYVRLLKNFDKVKEFVLTAVKDGGLLSDGSRINRMTKAVNDKRSCATLYLELSTVVAVAKPLVEATYLLEGNGPLALIAYDQVCRIKKFFELHKDNASWPGVAVALAEYTSVIAVIEGEAADENAIRAASVEMVKKMVEPVEEYFLSRIFGHLGPDVQLYKALRNANPLAINRTPPTAAEFAKDVESLDHFLPIEIGKMLIELPLYIDLASNWNPADGNADEVKSIVKFWKLHKDQMPSMCKFIRYAYTITTSSAPAERVFSVIKRSFDTGQKGALEDYVFLSAIMQFNKVEGTQEIKIA